ncbi:MAG: HNH endonuclease [Succinivibrio sp.]
MENLGSNILICKVSYNWYQVIKSNFISSGSSLVNCWYTPQEENSNADIDDPKAGTLTLFLVERDGRQMIVGGGYFLEHTALDIATCWYQFGVRSGYITYQDFIKRAKDFGADLNVPLACYLISSSFIFIRNHLIPVPEEFKIDMTGWSKTLVSTEEPLGAYLKKVSLETRYSTIDTGTAEGVWPGIYHKATIHRSIDEAAEFRTSLLGLYNKTCAVTGCSLLPVLSVAHIKTIYDDRYLKPDNAIIMRSDLHVLFSRGFITAYYEDPDTIKIRVSKRVKMNLDPEYSKLEGKILTLPKDRAYWPNPEYLSWHNSVRFENWLKYGEFSLIDAPMPMHPESK